MKTSLIWFKTNEVDTLQAKKKGIKKEMLYDVGDTKKQHSLGELLRKPCDDINNWQIWCDNEKETNPSNDKDTHRKAAAKKVSKAKLVASTKKIKGGRGTNNLFENWKLFDASVLHCECNFGGVAVLNSSHSKKETGRLNSGNGKFFPKGGSTIIPTK